MARSTLHEVFPYLRVKGADTAIAFYCDVFGAREKFRLVEPSGRIGHAELELGAITLMVSEEYPEYDIQAPRRPDPTGFALHLHVDDAEALAARAVAAGATMLRAPADQFYGERSCTIRDPFGHDWMIGHSIEDVPVDEMQRRYTAMFD
ncbi:putative glyoxalase superfamily protein PhnB [Panacagrimonas perspica]|uniref:Putative glyoxalase superfamily protein PhnB n=1 Tax=Panacagrimonas perspica TaxID=381431 RepID=A0A4S3JYZ9_9GAMM|nr:VOC family protein [Panacagrimonas perspica]TDU31410.1 putative glyoxalase superfamily protein PhnB [Panacagrimonas perspica]THD00817.1 glyxoylase [Panacagrimonas perspica]